MSTQNEVFKLNDKDYLVKKPGASEYNAAQADYNKTFGAALMSGGILRSKLQETMKKQGFWTEESDAEINNLFAAIGKIEKELAKGGIKLSEAKSKAIEMRKKRKQLTELLSDRAISDSNTVEGQAENAKFNRLLQLCLVYKDTGKPVYDKVDDLLNDSGNEVARKGYEILGRIIYQLDSDFDKKLPENKFLAEWGFVNDDLHLINEDGHPIDENGNLIDKEGRRVNEKGQRIDLDGEVIPDDDAPSASPFLDDEGNPLDLPKKQ